MPVMAIHERRTRRWSRIEYERLIDLGVFQPGDPIELIGGELLVAEPQGAPHYTATRKTARVLERAFGPSWDVRTQGPMGLDEESEPEPDVAVVPGSRRTTGVPSSRADRSSRCRIEPCLRPRPGQRLCQGRHPDYWIVNLVDRVLEVYREPAPDAAAPSARATRREVSTPASGQSSRGASPIRSATSRLARFTGRPQARSGAPSHRLPALRGRAPQQRCPYPRERGTG
jgi:Uma2 family endonuclease